MKMKDTILIFGVIALFLTASGIAFAQENHSLTVEAFSADLAAGSSFLEEEAGISAYSQVSNVDLDAAEDAFKNVEKKTEDYIIGSVALPDYGESDDVHVYVDINGWMVAYYLKQEKASKIIDWKHYLGGAITTTKLETALGKVCDAMYTYLTYVKYYDFRCPHGTKIMILTDEEHSHGATEAFRIMVPSDYPMYSRTWSHALYAGSGNIKIDGAMLNSFGGGSGWNIFEGDITASQLFPDIFHEILLYFVHYGGGSHNSYVGIVLIYQEPAE